MSEIPFKSDQRLLSFAGVAAPIIFTMLVIWQGWLQPDYSHIELPISALAAWPEGWLQTANFIILGTCTIAFAFGLHRGIAPVSAGWAGPALLALSGIGILLAATFPWQRAGDDLVVPAGHILGAMLAFGGTAAGHLVISRRMTRDPRWQGLATYVLVSGIVMLLLLIVTMALARPEDGPLHAYGGLLQRLYLAVWFPSMMVLAARLWR